MSKRESDKRARAIIRLARITAPKFTADCEREAKCLSTAAGVPALQLAAMFLLIDQACDTTSPEEWGADWRLMMGATNDH